MTPVLEGDTRLTAYIWWIRHSVTDKHAYWAKVSHLRTKSRCITLQRAKIVLVLFQCQIPNYMQYKSKFYVTVILNAERVIRMFEIISIQNDLSNIWSEDRTQEILAYLKKWLIYQLKISLWSCNLWVSSEYFREKEPCYLTNTG